MSTLDKNYWESRYEDQTAVWDIGYAAPAIVKFLETLSNKETAILIPGSGNGYEAEYLFKAGFKNVSIIDLATQPLDNFRKRNPDFPEKNLIQGDFFELTTTYDLIIEQTFFCALNPNLRSAYVEKMHQLLNRNGILAGLLFNCEFEKEGPPFGGNEAEYQSLFEPYFELQQFEVTKDSIPQRQGRELFIELRKKE